MISNQNHQDLGQTRRFYHYLGLKVRTISTDFDGFQLGFALRKTENALSPRLFGVGGTTGA